MKTYKVIFLDWDDTIGDFRKAAHRSLEEMYVKYGLANHYSSFEAFYSVFQPHNRWLWEQYGEKKVSKDYLEFDRFFYPLMMSERPPLTADAAEKAPLMAKEHLAHTTEFFSLLPDAEEVVRTLAQKYPLVIVSNGFAEVQYPKINISGLRDCFANVVLSEETGVPKPDKRIYETALARGGWKAEEAVMIGDTWSSDIQGAINAGIDQIWVQTDLAGQDPTLPATYKVAHLRDCLTMLM